MKSFLYASWALLIRDYRVRFGRTFLGVFWFLLPLFSLIAIVMVLGKDLGLYSEKSASTYFIQLLSGLMLWQLLADSWMQSLRLARKSNRMLLEVNFDQRIILGAGAMSALVSFGIKLPALIAVMLWFDYSMSLAILLIPLGMACLVAVGLAIACFMLPLSLSSLDIRYIVPFIQLAFLVSTPIFYIQPDSGLIYWINIVNPFTYLVIPIRNLVTENFVELDMLIITSIMSTSVFALGLVYFKSKIGLAIGYIGR